MRNKSTTGGQHRFAEIAKVEIQRSQAALRLVEGAEVEEGVIASELLEVVALGVDGLLERAKRRAERLAVPRLDEGFSF